MGGRGEMVIAINEFQNRQFEDKLKKCTAEKSQTNSTRKCTVERSQAFEKERGGWWNGGGGMVIAINESASTTALFTLLLKEQHSGCNET